MQEKATHIPRFIKVTLLGGLFIALACCVFLIPSCALGLSFLLAGAPNTDYWGELKVTNVEEILEEESFEQVDFENFVIPIPKYYDFNDGIPAEYEDEFAGPLGFPGMLTVVAKDNDLTLTPIFAEWYDLKRDYTPETSPSSGTTLRILIENDGSVDVQLDPDRWTFTSEVVGKKGDKTLEGLARRPAAWTFTIEDGESVTFDERLAAAHARENALPADIHFIDAAEAAIPRIVPAGSRAVVSLFYYRNIFVTEGSFDTFLIEPNTQKTIAHRFSLQKKKVRTMGYM